MKLTPVFVVMVALLLISAGRLSAAGSADEKRYEQMKKEGKLPTGKASTKKEWKEFMSREAGFSCLLPVVPKVKHEATEDGMITHSFEASFLSEGLLFQAICMIAPLSKELRAMAIDQAKNQFVKMGVVRSEKAINQDGHTGREFIIDLNMSGVTGSMIFRFIDADEEIYMFAGTHVGRKGEYPEAVKKFLDSIHLFERSEGAPETKPVRKPAKSAK